MILLLLLQIYLPPETYTVTANTMFQVVAEHDNYNTDTYRLIVDEVIALTVTKGSAENDPEIPPIVFHHKLPVGLYRVRVDAVAQKASQAGFGMPVFYSDTVTSSKTIHIYASPKPSPPVTITIK
ncbi:MAG: hypothetical protein ABWY25_01385 [Paenisporosarcina sp.]